MPTQPLIIGTDEATLVDADPNRTLILVQNIDTSNDIYVSDQPGLVANAQGILISHGGNLEMNKPLGWNTESVWYVAASGAGTLGTLFTSRSKI
jgi:hypothetical protein